ncbi:HAD hydrolase-like protein [Caballeronia sp. LZ065]|uniref:HAD family hydrolase n=1 Tax=Caballeronia sp. LZ065 TaxID=3038571 RepID=UPI0028587C5F|nr:HAD hydrolase-like protein [Caballeronia sp. LZ065]MDR5781830.1 HAD hydrolase-like protein [Caballeronia sp. LZ065]
MNTKAHIVWDWNGTLLNDVSIALEATNRALRHFNLEALSLEDYRARYCVPVHDFYSSMLGREIQDAELDAIGVIFNAFYRDAIHLAPLAHDAREVIASRKSQSICSLLKQPILTGMIRRFEIDAYFCRVHGRDFPLTRNGKLDHLAAHVDLLKRTHGVEANTIVVIGDSIDDALAARAAGIHVVLYSSGTHSHERLSQIGVPVAHSLTQAATFADAIALNQTF